MPGLESTSPLRERHLRFALAQSERSPVLSSDLRGGAASGHRAASDSGDPDLEYLPYASPDADGAGVGPTRPVCELLASYGAIEPEYAAIRRGAALFDATFRGTIAVTGAERREFLQRMLTQDVRAGDPTNAKVGKVCRAFWLNRKGRIEADLVLADLAQSECAAHPRILIDVDRTKAESVTASLGKFIISEDVQLANVTNATHRLELHGPAAGRMLALAGATTIPGVNEAADTTVGGVAVTLIRADSLGEGGWTIVVEVDRVGELWDALLAVRDPHDERRRVRPIGWHAYNIARIEAGTPIFQIDFGSTNLAHESGVLHDRVSFKKGCYLGQEVVARMESLGRPKQVLVGLRPTTDLLPVAGAQVFAISPNAVETPTEAANSGDMAGSIGEQVGTVTSSTLAPMLGAVPIAFAMVRTTHSEPGTALLVNAEGGQCRAIVGGLRSWPAGSTGSEGAKP
jgi:folate-binding protein YgfZ